jgi:hypothetical protein
LSRSRSRSSGTHPHDTHGLIDKIRVQVWEDSESSP